MPLLDSEGAIFSFLSLSLPHFWTIFNNKCINFHNENHSDNQSHNLDFSINTQCSLCNVICVYIAGEGVFARNNVTKGTVFCVYSGFIMSRQETRAHNNQIQRKRIEQKLGRDHPNYLAQWQNQ